MNEWVPILVAIIASLPGVFAFLKGRGKERADSAEVIIKSAQALHVQLAARVELLEKENTSLCEESKKRDGKIADLEITISEMALVIESLVEQLTKLGHRPEVNPKLLKKMIDLTRVRPKLVFIASEKD